MLCVHQNENCLLTGEAMHEEWGLIYDYFHTMTEVNLLDMRRELFHTMCDECKRCLTRVIFQDVEVFAKNVISEASAVTEGCRFILLKISECLTPFGNTNFLTLFFKNMECCEGSENKVDTFVVRISYSEESVSTESLRWSLLVAYECLLRKNDSLKRTS